jgi:non-ribosomal peptide synthetase component F
VRNILQGESLTALTHDYIDYSYWQKSDSERWNNQRNYWKEKLSGELPIIDLSFMEDREGLDLMKANIVSLNIAEDHYEQIKGILRNEEITDFMFFISLYFVLLQKITGQEDLIIGTDVVGRTHASTKNIVGTFVNILPLRMNVAQEQSFIKFLSEVKEGVLGAFSHQDVQFEDMVKMIELPENPNILPIVQVHFTFNNYEKVREGFQIDDVRYTPINLLDNATTQYDFKIEALDTGNSYQVDFIFSEALYEVATIEMFKEYYQSIMTSVLQNNSVMLGDIDLA